MAKWYQLSEYVDSIKAQLTPEENKVIQATVHTNGMWAGQESELLKAAQRVLMKRLGMDETASMNFLQFNGNVLNNGDKDVEAVGWDKNGKSFKDSIGSRAEYKSDDEYFQKLLGAYGLNYGKPTNADGSPVTAGQPADPQVDQISKRISDFANAMGFTDPNDPTGQMIQRHALSAGRSFAGNAGAGPRSGLGQTSVAGMTAQGLQQYDFQRKGLQQQALGMLSNRDVSLGQLDQGWAGLQLQATNMQNQLAESKWGADKNQAQGVGAALGTVGGGIVGAYFGGPAGAGAGASVGAQLGAGLGGLGSGGGGPVYRQPSVGVRRSPGTGF